MTALVVAPARSEREVRQAQELASSVFEPASGIAEYASYKALLWLEDPTFAPENLMLAYLGEGPPCGLVRIVPRVVSRGDQAFTVAGISSVCLKPALRGRGLSVPLMEQTLATCRKRGFDLAFLFARRAADHYYTRFGFWGVAAYSRTSVRLANMAPDPRLTLSGDSPERYLDIYQTAYDRCYRNVFGRFSRSPADWRYLLRRLSFLGHVRFSVLRLEGEAVGYALWNDGVVHELAWLDGARAPAIAALLGATVPGAAEEGALDLEISSEHRFVEEAYGLDIKVSRRECIYGGHMACILSPEAALDRMAERSPVAASKFSHLANMERFTHRDTCRLLGAWSPTDCHDSAETALPLDISFSDHF